MGRYPDGMIGHSIGEYVGLFGGSVLIKASATVGISGRP